MRIEVGRDQSLVSSACWAQHAKTLSRGASRIMLLRAQRAMGAAGRHHGRSVITRRVFSSWAKVIAIWRNATRISSSVSVRFSRVAVISVTPRETKSRQEAQDGAGSEEPGGRPAHRRAEALHARQARASATRQIDLDGGPQLVGDVGAIGRVLTSQRKACRSRHHR